MSAAEKLTPAQMVAAVIEEAAPENWTVHDLEDLDWGLSRVADLEREVAENNRLAEEAIQRIKLRTDVLNERAERGAAFFREQVSIYAQAHRDELLGGGKKKSRTFLHGTVGWRKKGGGIEVKDPAALLTWAQAQPVELGLVRIKEEPALADIKLHVKKTGELPDGCELSPEIEELTVKAEMGDNYGN